MFDIISTSTDADVPRRVLAKKLLGEGNSLARVNSQRAEHVASPLLRRCALKVAPAVGTTFGAVVISAPCSGFQVGAGSHGVLGVGELRQLVVLASLSARRYGEDSRAKVSDGHLANPLLETETSVSELAVSISVSVSVSVSVSISVSVSVSILGVDICIVIGIVLVIVIVPVVGSAVVITSVIIFVIGTGIALIVIDIDFVTLSFSLSIL